VVRWIDLLVRAVGRPIERFLQSGERGAKLSIGARFGLPAIAQRFEDPPTGAPAVDAAIGAAGFGGADSSFGLEGGVSW
jgi:hypothetical protein